MQLCATPVVRRFAAVSFAALSVAAAAACTEVVADSSACRTLEYKDGGVERSKYLPCAAEMIAALDDLDRQSKAALNGDAQARADGQNTLRKAMGLMAAAGGRQLLERWPDRTLTELNVNISNALTKYQAFYMVRILDDGNQFARDSRLAAAAGYEGGSRRYDQAKRIFNRIN